MSANNNMTRRIHSGINVTDTNGRTSADLSGGGADNAKFDYLDVQVQQATLASGIVRIDLLGANDDSGITTVYLGLGGKAPSAAGSISGVILPGKTTTQRGQMASMPAGTLVYNSTTNKLNFYNGSAWEAVTSA